MKAQQPRWGASIRRGGFARKVASRAAGGRWVIYILVVTIRRSDGDCGALGLNLEQRERALQYGATLMLISPASTRRPLMRAARYAYFLQVLLHVRGRMAF